MKANNTNTDKKIPQFDYAALAGAQPLAADASCSCGGAHHLAALSRAAMASETRSDSSPQATLAAGSMSLPLEKFTWYIGAQTAEQDVISQAQDVTYGLVEILSLLEQDDIADDCGDARMFTPSRRGHLMRMAITSAQMLGNQCSSMISHTNEQRRAK